MKLLKVPTKQNTREDILKIHDLSITIKGSFGGPIQGWGCGGNHLYRDCPHGNAKPRNIHNIEEETTIEDVARSTHKIYVALEINKQIIRKPVSTHVLNFDAKRVKIRVGRKEQAGRD